MNFEDWWKDQVVIPSKTMLAVLAYGVPIVLLQKFAQQMWDEIDKGDLDDHK